uniref:NADH-ubiquinone oxidoreductase chain 6 n=1 Tax=Haplomitrium mnioides TaxID=56921 RepID=A0A6C0SK13_9MARC|nr:NADH dehydrogenase subunit 6 [Haplomitrium mnioides]QIA60198.1 NADH dehydrogenase subunit 6 [Haplomitrium mnioides]
MILFHVFVVLASVSGAMVIRAKNPVHSVLFSIPVLRNTSGLLVSLGPDFFAMIFPVVYVGAIAASFSSVVTMLHMGVEEIHENVLRYLPVGGIIGLISPLEIFLMVDNDYIPILPTKLNATCLTYTVYAGKIHSWTNLETLGNSPHTTYFSLFLVSSLIPLVALIGAIVLTMHKTTKVKRQDVFVQNAIDFRNTIRKVRRKCRRFVFW